MSAINSYLNRIKEIIDTAAEREADSMEAAAQMLYEATKQGKNLYTFGNGHASLLALELYYRTGGMATFNPISAPGLMLDLPKALMTTDMERLEGYGQVIFNNSGIVAGDVIIIHSVSGRNPATIDMAMACREAGVKVIILTNMNTSTVEPSRHSGGKNLYEFGDIVIDNCGDYGDAAMSFPGFPQKVAPSSTAVGAALLYAVVARTVELLLEDGIMPPVFVSANVEGGDEHNKKVLEQYKDHIFYM